jgi:hypothetical protein
MKVPWGERARSPPPSEEPIGSISRAPLPPGANRTGVGQRGFTGTQISTECFPSGWSPGLPR